LREINILIIQVVIFRAYDLSARYTCRGQFFGFLDLFVLLELGAGKEQTNRQTDGRTVYNA